MRRLKIKIVILFIIMFFSFILQKNIIINADNIFKYFKTVYNDLGDPVISFRVLENTGDIIMVGSHVRSGSEISYRTMKHTITLHPSKKNPLSLGVGKYCIFDRDDTSIEIDDGIKDPNIVKDTYLIEGQTLIKGLITLMENDRDENGKRIYPTIKDINKALSDGITIYLSNAFQVIERPGGSGTEKEKIKYYGNICYSKDEILDEVKRLGFGDWSENTRLHFLPFYFDIPVTFKLQPFYCNVVYITAEDYAAGRTSSEYILGTAATGLTAICGSEVEYEMEDPSNIEINNQLYEFAGASYYAYWGKNSFYDTVVEGGNTVRTTHDYQRDSTMYIIVKSKGDNPVSVDYVDEEGTTLRRNISAGAATQNYPYKYSPEEILQNGSNYYEYTGKWSYSYTDNKGNLKESGMLSGTPGFTLRDAGEKEPVKITAVYKDIGKAEERVTSFSYMDTEAVGVIKADEIGNEKYDVTKGIPSSETLYTTIQTKEYLLNIEFVRKTGKKIYSVPYEKTYYLSWTEPYSGEPEMGEDGLPLPTPEPVSQYDTETVTGTVLIEREYAYTEVAKIDYYKIEHGEIKNEALPDKTVILKPSGYEVPSLNYSHDNKESSHITDPAEIGTTIKLPSKSITSYNYFRPSVPTEDVYSAVDQRISEITVKNDYLEFNETVILDASLGSKKTENAMVRKIRKAGITDQDVLFTSNLQIPSELSNGVYNTEGTIVYERVKSLNSTLPDRISAEVENLNVVQVHTPVYCFGEMMNDNKQYVQLVTPDLSAVPIVLDETGASNDFIVSISNTGYHTDKKGYREQNYAKYVAEEDGVKLNQVKFMFDVVIDVENDGKTENDILLKKDSWYTVGTEEQRFYVPLYVEEGIYRTDFRSIAVNGIDKLEESEIYANRELTHYVAENSAQVQISGKLYGLSVYDISDYPLWQNVFRKTNGTTLKVNDTAAEDGTKASGFHAANAYTYAVGAKNELGNTTGRLLKYTFPIINGSHPLYKNQGAIKEGYTVRFTLDTVGNVMEQQASKIVIKPYFYFVSADGRSREEVDVYYRKQQGKKSIVVKVGSETELADAVTAKTGDYLLGIPEAELADTASALGMKPAILKKQTAVMYRYSLIESSPAFKTFSGASYADQLINGLSRVELLKEGISRTVLLSKKQSYYFNYSIPADAIAVTKGTDLSGYAAKKGLKGNESFIKKNGYLMVNVEIIAYDSTGNAYMSYINQENYLRNGQACMWLLEGAPSSKTDSAGNTFSLRAGDFLMFRLDESVKDDYRSGGIY